MNAMVTPKRTTWWLDTSALPELFWARLCVHGDGRAEVLDLDGRLHQFPDEDEARKWLREDEYDELDYLRECGDVPAALEPPREYA
jgi:hypothetical protein